MAQFRLWDPMLAQAQTQPHGLKTQLTERVEDKGSLGEVLGSQSLKISCAGGSSSIQGVDPYFLA